MGKLLALAAIVALAFAFGCTDQRVVDETCSKDKCTLKGMEHVDDYNGSTGIIVMPGQAEPSVGLSCTQFSACLAQGSLSARECANKYIGYTIVDDDDCVVKHVAYFCQA